MPDERCKGLHDCNHNKSAVPVSSFISTRNRLYRVSASDVFDELRNSLQRDHLILPDPTTITKKQKKRTDDARWNLTLEPWTQRPA